MDIKGSLCAAAALAFMLGSAAYAMPSAASNDINVSAPVSKEIGLVGNLFCISDSNNADKS